MVYLIIIGILSGFLLAFGILHIFCMNRDAKIIQQYDALLRQSGDNLTDYINKYSKLVDEYAASLDIHSKNLNTMIDKNTELSKQLEIKELECVRLEASVESLRTENEALSKFFSEPEDTKDREAYDDN